MFLVWKDGLCSAPSPSASVLADASLPPARTCPDHLALLPGRSCLSVCQVVLCPAPSPAVLMLVDASLPPVRTSSEVSQTHRNRRDPRIQARDWRCSGSILWIDSALGYSGGSLSDSILNLSRNSVKDSAGVLDILARETWVTYVRDASAAVGLLWGGYCEKQQAPPIHVMLLLLREAEQRCNDRAYV
jgi:hypothetical protein